MNNKAIGVFYGDKSLTGYSYVFFFQNLTDGKRHDLASMISNHGGVFFF
jgi:hypothetical protein